MDDEQLADAVVRKMDACGYRLRAAGLVRAHEVIRPAGVDTKLVVVSAYQQSWQAEVVMQGSTEVFELNLGKCYSMVRTAYAAVDKLEEVDDLMDTLEAYLHGRAYQKVYVTASGQEIHRDLYLRAPDGAGVRWAGSHDFPSAQVRRMVARRSYVLPAEGARPV